MTRSADPPRLSAIAVPSPAVEEAFNDAYAFLRKAIGLIAFSLPIAVVLGKGWLDHSWRLEGSISAYYFTHSRNYFVGGLCALAVFFLSYEYRHFGKYRADNYLSNFASAAALGVAFLPMTRGGVASTGPQQAVGVLHYLCAASLFLALAVFCLVFFTRSQGGMTPQKVLRNRLYRACGWVILGCLALCPLALWKAPEGWHALFWLEAVMVWAFAVSWLVKGGFQGVLADQPAATATRRP